MSRQPLIDRPVRLVLMLPESVRARLDLHLYSPLEGRVPKGNYQSFFLERISEFFQWRRLELAPFGFPAGYFIAGPREMIDTLERRLNSNATIS